MYEIKSEDNKSYNLQKKTFIIWLKLFFLIAIIYTIFIVIVILGIYYLNLGYRWMILSIDEWITSGIILLGILILFEIIFYVISSKRTTPLQEISPVSTTPLFQGKHLHIYTHPHHVKGGIFSRTYIQLDDNTVIQIRTQMIPAEQLWKK
ncbi:MAG: hypothetical protein V1726_06590 [Methanobacteriota archaeon]